MQLLDDGTRVLYNELLDLTRQAEAERLARGVPGGSFVKKAIRERTYWYLQRHEAGSRRQIYLGPESKELLETIERVQEAKTDLEADAAVRRRLCRMLEAGGAFRESAAVVQILDLLSEADVFRLGGVLIGTHAFAVYANFLGVRFEASALRTQDIDVAGDPVAIAVGSERTDAEAALRRSDLDWLPVPKLDPRHPSTSFHVRGRQLRVDFLTPMRGRHDGRPVRLAHLGVAAQPLRFLEYLLGEPIQAVVVGGAGVLVSVPDPSRFAFHKLWTAGKRPAVEHARSAKDRLQAGQLLEILCADRPDDVVLAWQDLESYPKARKRIAAAFDLLPENAREATHHLLS